MARPRVVDDDRLLDAAAEVLAEVGPAAFTLALAGARAGVAPATYVKRYGSRRGVFLALNVRWVAAIDAELAVGGDGERVGADALREALLWGVADMDDPTQAAHQLATLALDLADPEMQVLLDRGWALQQERVAALVRDVAATGALPGAPPPEQAARMLLALVEGTRIGWCVRPEGSLERRVRDHVDALLAAWTVGPSVGA